MSEATFRFYEELNDFLLPRRRKVAFAYTFRGTPSIKDAIEALGVPHVEVDLVLVDGKSVTFHHLLRGGEVVSVYPVFESLDIGDVTRLRPQPLRESRFVVDVHLGRLAVDLRLLGFDTLWRNDYRDSEIVALSVEDKRIVLTRDLGILKTAAIQRGYWLRATDPCVQIREVITRLDLKNSFKPFTRCMSCNGDLHAVEKSELEDELEERTRIYYNEFHRCRGCGKIYWQGTHYLRLRERVNALRAI